jgi:hypothetical protein
MQAACAWAFNLTKSYVTKPGVLGYVEGLNDARTKLAGFFSSLLGWEERAPTEESIGTAEILAGL